jgi:type VI protein secretion system component VasK
VSRALLWLLVGVAVLAIAVVAVAPELLRADVRATSELAVIAVAAGLPGAVVLAVIAWSRRRHDPADGPNDRTASQRHDRATPDDPEA